MCRILWISYLVTKTASRNTISRGVKSKSRLSDTFPVRKIRLLYDRCGLIYSNYRLGITMLLVVWTRSYVSTVLEESSCHWADVEPPSVQPQLLCSLTQGANAGVAGRRLPFPCRKWLWCLYDFENFISKDLWESSCRDHMTQD